MLALTAAWGTLAVAAVETIALRGDQAVPTGNATFSSFSTPSLNNRGQVAFAAQLAGSDVTTGNDTGYWIASNGSIGTVLREGGAAPGLAAGKVFGGLSTLFNAMVPLNDAGDIAVGMSATQTSGLWIGNDQSLTLLAAQGAAAPSAENGATFGTLAGGRVTLNRRGDAAFTANLLGAPYTTINSENYNDGLWILNRSGPVAVMLAGMNAPAISDQAQFAGFRTFTYPLLNGNGAATVDAYHRVPNVGSAYIDSKWVASGGGVELRGVQGKSLPEIGPNATLGFVTMGGFNSAGTIAATASYSNPGNTPSSGSGVIVSNSTGISFVARLGGPAPGTSGHQFTSFSYEPSLSSRGHVAFESSEWDGTSSATTRSGIWAGRPNDLQLVAREGDAAPNASATFGSFIRDTPAINRFGQVAFPAFLATSPGAPTTTSLWATDLDGGLTLIARAGDSLEVAPGDVRTISSLTMLTDHGDDDGLPRSLNDLGQIVFGASFANGTSGIFISNVVAHLPGDYSGDGVIDARDYVKWRKAVATQNLAADGTRDGVVDGEDYALVREFFGQSLTLGASGLGLTSVPEPTTLLLLAMTGVVFFRRSR